MRIDDAELIYVASIARDAKHRITAPYVEQFWTPIWGPTALLVARWLSVALDEQGTLIIDPQVEGHRFGLGKGRRFCQALERLDSFNVAIWDAPQRTISLYDRVPNVSHGTAMARYNPTLLTEYLNAHQRTHHDANH